MKMTDVYRSLFGGFIVYVTMAACSGMGNDTTGGGNASGGSPGQGGFGGVAHGGNGGQTGSAQGGMGQGGKDAGDIFDALTDPVPNASADPTSGTRLKAKYRTGDDGSKAYIPGVWFDSQRNEDCSFNKAVDGKERCMPSGIGVVTSTFADPTCTQFTAVTSSGCSPKYATAYDTSSCGTSYTYHLYSVGTLLSTIYYKSGNTCVSGTPPAGYSYYALGAEIPASSFVGSTVSYDP